MFDVVSCPASSSRLAMPMSSSSVSSAPCSRTSMPRMSSPGWRRDRSTSEPHVGAALPLQFEPLGNRNGQVQLAGAAALEVVAVVVRHAEQLADHQRRDRQREALHQIRWRPGAFPSRRVAASTISAMRGSSRFIRRMVNSGVSMRRSR